MRAQNELLDAIQILIDKSMADRSTRITGGAVKSASGGLATVTINGYDYSIPYSGTAPTVGSTVRVFIPNGNMSDAFIGGGGGGGGGSTGTTNYNNLTNKPSINGVTLSGNKTSTELGVYGTGNEPPYPVTSVNGKTGAVTVSVPTVPTTTSLLKGNGSGGLVAATPETDYASPVFMRKVTLTVAGWNSSTKQQSVTVTGILADTTKQCIYPAPVDTSYDSEWNSCGVLCVAQEANSLTFQCGEIPTSAIEVYVTVITLSYKG